MCSWCSSVREYYNNLPPSDETPDEFEATNVEASEALNSRPNGPGAGLGPANSSSHRDDAHYGRHGKRSKRKNDSGEGGKPEPCPASGGCSWRPAASRCEVRTCVTGPGFISFLIFAVALFFHSSDSPRDASRFRPWWTNCSGRSPDAVHGDVSQSSAAYAYWWTNCSGRSPDRHHNNVCGVTRRENRLTTCATMNNSNLNFPTLVKTAVFDIG